MFIDFSRESYIPFQMLQGKTLIKDIFLIYGPFGYIINFLLYKITVNINLLIILSHLISYLIIILFYFILRQFKSEKISLLFTIFFIIASIFSYSTFNYIVPYSYSTLWAIFGIYLILYSILYNKKSLIFLSLGLILCSKIEYFIPCVIISFGYLIYKKESFKRNILYILVFPLITVTYFIFHKITLADFLNNFYYIKQMLKTDALEYLYKGMGVYYLEDYFKYNLVKLLKISILSAISYIIYKFKPVFSIIILLVGLFYLNTNESFNLILFVNLILAIYLIKKHQINEKEIILLIFSIILSSKAMFAINSLTYSNFGYCLMLAILFIMLEKIINKKWLISFFICFFAINILGNCVFMLLTPKRLFKTNVGKIAIDEEKYREFLLVNEYIEKNIKNNESLIVLPEGQIFNLTHKLYHPFFNSTFTPLDFETFKDDYFIQKLKENKTDYIIFYPRNTFDYGKINICYDYAVDFCKYIIDNYDKEELGYNTENVRIYKRKK